MIDRGRRYLYPLRHQEPTFVLSQGEQATYETDPPCRGMCYPNFKRSVPFQNHSREGTLDEMVEEGGCKQHTGNESRRGSETEMKEGLE